MSNPKFQKGGPSPNPNGRYGLPPDIKEARKLSREVLERALHKCLMMPFNELQDVVKDWERSSIEVMVANIVLQATSKADHLRLGFILDRLGLVARKPEEDKGLQNESRHAEIVEALNQIEYGSKDK